MLPVYFFTPMLGRWKELFFPIVGAMSWFSRRALALVVVENNQDTNREGWPKKQVQQM